MKISQDQIKKNAHYIQLTWNLVNTQSGIFIVDQTRALLRNFLFPCTKDIETDQNQFWYERERYLSRVMESIQYNVLTKIHWHKQKSFHISLLEDSSRLSYSWISLFRLFYLHVCLVISACKVLMTSLVVLCWHAGQYTFLPLLFPCGVLWFLGKTYVRHVPFGAFLCKFVA